MKSQTISLLTGVFLFMASLANAGSSEEEGVAVIQKPASDLADKEFSTLLDACANKSKQSQDPATTKSVVLRLDNPHYGPPRIPQVEQAHGISGDCVRNAISTARYFPEVNSETPVINQEILLTGKVAH